MIERTTQYIKWIEPKVLDDYFPLRKV